MDTKDDKQTNGSLVTRLLTRKQALEDGVLIDVSATAQEMGFGCQVAFVRTAWDRYIRTFPGASEWDEDARVREVLSGISEAIRFFQAEEQSVPYRFYLEGWPLNQPDMPSLLRFDVFLGRDQDDLSCITIALAEDTTSDC